MFSEQDVDRELKAALSVSPSADFEARVLQRVEEARAPHWTSGHGWFAAAASLVIGAGLFYALNRTPVVQHPTARPVQPVVEHRPPAPTTAPAPSTVAADERPRARTVHAPRTAPRAGEPEVIVPVNQMEAVRRLVRAVNEGRVPTATEPLETLTTVPAEVAVRPLVVDPIPVPALDPGAEPPSPIIRGQK